MKIVRVLVISGQKKQNSCLEIPSGRARSFLSETWFRQLVAGYIGKRGWALVFGEVEEGEVEEEEGKKM